MTVHVGNIYNTASGNVFLVESIDGPKAYIRNIRTNARSEVALYTVLNHFILIGTPYNQEPVNETDPVHGK